MASLPVNVTLAGKNATNPALPQQNIRGTLYVEHNNLTFEGENFIYQIPLEHADSIYAYEERESWGEDWRYWLTVFPGISIFIMTFGIGIIPWIWFFWWEYTSVEVFLAVKAWDEEYGLTATTMFRLGKRKKYRTEVNELIQEIWRIRGNNRGDDRRGGQLIYRS